MTTIAFIDDETYILNAINRLLRAKDWKILTYSSPEQAIAELRFKTDVNVIVSDYRMLGMNGVEVLSELKEICPNAIRILLSGQADLNSVLQAINQAEIYRFITKPWIDEDFVFTLCTAIDFQKLTQENMKLSQIVRNQKTTIDNHLRELNRLERESPGLTKVSWNEDGCIDISNKNESEFDDV